MLVGVVYGLGFGSIVKLVTDLLDGYEGPGWQKLGLILLPWLILAMTWRFLKKISAEDELEKIINRDALAFVAYGLVAGLVVLGQLQAAGLMPEFKWANGQILLVVIFLLLCGIFWSSRRFR